MAIQSCKTTKIVIIFVLSTFLLNDLIKSILLIILFSANIHKYCIVNINIFSASIRNKLLQNFSCSLLVLRPWGHQHGLQYGIIAARCQSKKMVSAGDSYKERNVGMRLNKWQMHLAQPTLIPYTKGTPLLRLGVQQWTTGHIGAIFHSFFLRSFAGIIVRDK